MFEKITKIIDDIVAFIKSFAANLTKFVGGFKNDYEFVTEAADGE